MARPRKTAVAPVAAQTTTESMPVKVEAKPQAAEVKPEIKTVVAEQKPSVRSKAKPYLVGTTDDCPYWNLNLGGCTFHRETAELIPGKRGDDDILTQGPAVRGHLEMLTPEAIERIKRAAKTKVIRWNSPPRWEEIIDPVTGNREKVFKGNGRIYSSGPRGPEAPPFVPQDGDEPIGKYIYCMDVSTLNPADVLGDRRRITVKTVYEAMEDGTL